MRALAVLVAVVMVGCGPKAGESCSESANVCESSTATLWCDGGKWVRYACPGEFGCFKSTPNSVTELCDFRGSVVGTRCPAQSGIGFCADGTTFVTCTIDNGAGVWTAQRCSSCRTESGSLSSRCLP